MIPVAFCLASLVLAAAQQEATECLADDPICSPSEEESVVSLLQVSHATAKTLSGNSRNTTPAPAAPDDSYAYISTFVATGCPNPEPSRAQIKWWQKQPQKKTLRDMYRICKANEEGRAKPGQKKECCGAVGCEQIGCVEQDAFQINDDGDDGNQGDDDDDDEDDDDDDGGDDGGDDDDDDDDDDDSPENPAKDGDGDLGGAPPMPPAVAPEDRAKEGNADGDLGGAPPMPPAVVPEDRAKEGNGKLGGADQ